MSVVARIGKRYTLVIPREIRKIVGLKEGSRVLLRVSGRSIIIDPLPEDPFKVLEKVIGEPYREEVDENKAIKWLLKNAHS